MTAGIIIVLVLAPWVLTAAIVTLNDIFRRRDQ